MFAAAVAVAMAVPASAKVVQFTAQLKAGIGDGGNPPTTSTPAANGLPACAKGLTTHLNATLPAAGFVEVGAGATPSIMAVRPFKYGTAGPANGIGAHPSMMAGVNGAPQFSTISQGGDCTITFDEAHLSGMIVGRTQMSFAYWPAQYSVFTTTAPTSAMSPPTMSATGRHVLGTGLEMHTVGAGMGPGNINFVPGITMAGVNMALTIVAGPNQFGGGFRASGGGRVDVAAEVVTGVTATGFWFSGPRIGGHNQPTATQTVTMSGSFTLGATMIPVELRAWLFPLTTGMVRNFDDGGDFTTERIATGGDNRTNLGEAGTLTLVSPFLATLEGLDVYFGGNLSSTITFAPEPGPTALFAAGVLGVIAISIASRRRK